MKINNDLYDLARNYIRESIQRSAFPTPSSIERHLNIEFGEDWSILLPKYELANWFNKLNQLLYLTLSEGVEEIIIHNPKNSIFIYSEKSVNSEIDLTDEDLEISYELLCLKKGIDWNLSNPFVSFKSIVLGNPCRITLTHKSLSQEHSHKCSIRFHSKKTYPIEKYFKSVEEEKIIMNVFYGKSNLLICGATGSGKTSFLSSLLNHVEENEHLFIIEDTHEIISPNNCCTRLVSNKLPGHSLKDFCAYSLRMRPDRLIVGEIRSNEVVPLILNSNNGHKGLISTLHANSAVSAPQRLATLLCLYSNIQGMDQSLALELIANGIDVIIFMEEKKVTHAIKLLNHENGVIHFDEILEPNNEQHLMPYPFVS
ncbi:hypothetical protein A9Q84_09245 [Halobacteriovorax marinus]|uniref:Bacterial type II secretion system protein E domain-containing protein n=1 Tax=Halobacteriovorax marinus TaxID=97084 RepID=A0A1Y5F6V4_9BACT|nr:hypothetical protein A9Q84_09245 [Halobacteriovorax marinus]